MKTGSTPALEPRALTGALSCTTSSNRRQGGAQTSGVLGCRHCTWAGSRCWEIEPAEKSRQLEKLDAKTQNRCQWHRTLDQTARNIKYWLQQWTEKTNPTHAPRKYPTQDSSNWIADLKANRWRIQNRYRQQRRRTKNRERKSSLIAHRGLHKQ
jgi:hypothetical protein